MRKFLLSFFAFVFCVLIVGPAFAGLIDYTKNGIAQDTSADTYTCQTGSPAADCPRNIYFLQVCNDAAAGGASLYTDYTGATAVSNGSTTTAHEIKATECDAFYTDDIKFSAVSGSGSISIRFSFRARIL